MALAWHVDYWDYLGWKDPYAAKEFTERQRRYRQAKGLKQMGTPHFFVNNESFWGRGVREAVAGAGARPAALEIEAEAAFRKGKVHVAIRLAEEDAFTPTKTTAVRAVLYQRAARTECTAGENRGKTLEEFFLVRRVSKALSVGEAAKAGVEAVLDVPEGLAADNLGVAVLVEDEEKLQTLQCRDVPVTVR